jgi:hypothetical protein
MLHIWGKETSPIKVVLPYKSFNKNKRRREDYSASLIIIDFALKI